MGDDKALSASDSTRYAGFWRRFLAVCIDLILSAPLYYGMKYCFGEHGWLGETVFAVLMIAAYAFFFSSRWQGTPGMHILKFHISDTEGKRIGFGRGLYWILSSLVIWAICFAGIIYLQSRFDIFAVQDLRVSCYEENLANEDCAHEIESLINIPYPSFMNLIYASLGLFVFLTFIWALSIALPKDKTGFHNLLCKTRFLKGRP